ncbi:MAG: dTMP kinase [Candidatus Glassbacteria bacterium]|nr:dTMP kinase [Candidatus Glassbacteria bacterium]
MKRGIFITVEGGEGVGKSTQIGILGKKLKAKGYDVVETHDPGGTKIGGRIRSIVLEKEHKELSQETELLLFLAARAQLVQEIIIPNLAAGKIVISDRFYHSTYAYQGGARGIEFETVKALNEFAISGTRPDITFLLDLTPDLGFKRMEPKSNKERAILEEQVTLSLHLPSDNQRINIDRIEREGDKFHEEVRNSFLRLASIEPERIVVIDSARPKEEVASQIENRVLQLLDERSRQ